MAAAALAGLATLPALAQVPPPGANPARSSSAAVRVVSPPLPAPMPDEPGKRFAPRPVNPSEIEIGYRKRADELIAPILKHDTSEDDLAKVRETFSAVAKGGFDSARAIARGISDSTAQKLVAWYLLVSGVGEAEGYRRFLQDNPAWPRRGFMIQRMEEALFTQGGKADEIRSFFPDGKPETAIGEAALASAYLATGDKDKARALAAKAWRDGDIPSTLETGFIERFGPLLTPADHRWRLDRFLLSDRRWSSSRKQQATYIRRIIALLPEAEKKKADARLAVYMRSSSAAKLMDELPHDDTADWGLAFQRVQLLRRNDRSTEAVKILLSAPTDPTLIVSPDDWWDERRANAYDALESDNFKLAYELVREAGPLSVNPLKEQRFMAGWIAMRYLKDAGRALQHFKDMREVADGPMSRSKGDYWIGRALEALGRAEEARGYYDRATRERDTFHGLLAQQRLKPGRQTIEIGAPALPTAAEVESLHKLDSLRAAVIAHEAKLGGNIVRPFLANARVVQASEAWSGLIAHLADALGDTQMSLRIAKSALADGHNLLIYSYPTSAFPAYRPLRDPPEPAFLLGIARQETEFNTQIVSGAGARGLLQVMPVTARHVCRDHKIKCDIARLLSDKVYNTMIGSAYIGDRMAEFDGNYVLTLAGYNAGPGRARQWMRAFGDPRSSKLDAVDWIERIPFQETREYVAKVLSNIQIYRARVGDQPALRLDEDLGRTR
ncbi:MAG: transglycosylase SLT domain-containing protein [Hyphomicrobiaceae bacterium]|nr:transglycosylase SLT domain-containing protein [Hyphomicrobiaceae bacterium]